LKVLWIKILDIPPARLKEVNRIHRMVIRVLKKEGLDKEYIPLVSNDLFEVSVEDLNEMKAKFDVWLKSKLKVES
jgi:hypothetical protein